MISFNVDCILFFIIIINGAVMGGGREWSGRNSFI